MKSVVYNSFGVWRIYNSAGVLKIYSPVTCEETNLMETECGFSLCCDNKDNIFIICQNGYGDIYFIVVNGENIQKNCMLESKVKNAYEKHFKTVYVNGWINAFYLLEHENKRILIHHIINSENQPGIIETVDEETPLFVNRKGDDLYLFYVKNNSVMCKKFRWNEKQWEDPETLCSEENKIVYINAYFTDKVNVVCCTQNKDRYNAFFATEDYKCELVRNSSSLLKPVICEKDGVMHILLEYGGRILESTDENKSDVISRAKYSYFGTFEKSEAVEINTPELEKIYTYGYETKKGEFTPLVTGDIKIHKITSVTEVKSELEEEQPQQKAPQDIYGEILKMLDKSNEMKILSELCSKISALEDAVLKLLKGSEENGN